MQTQIVANEKEANSKFCQICKTKQEGEVFYNNVTMADVVNTI